MKERILCAALLYKGRIVAGYRHHDCYQTIADLNNLNIEQIPDCPGRDDQGFLTSHGRFVNRAEGYRIARENDQLLLKHTEGSEEILISENLY